MQRNKNISAIVVYRSCERDIATCATARFRGIVTLGASGISSSFSVCSLSFSAKRGSSQSLLSLMMVFPTNMMENRVVQKYINPPHPTPPREASFIGRILKRLLATSLIRINTNHSYSPISKINYC